MARILMILLAMTMLAGCGSKERPDLRSPCVGADDSPCGERRNVNDWWLT